ncbi:hypothetical protein SETIT_3G146600v2 [Setaria italica]|uniref:Uncharacterized protein n=1 Tax=Setaria italica TaxID=4555 RepID=A0A368QEX6_SETIT|nr:hypothetical protein SETIT_3G146600v2 [Setaria italica]
MLPLTSAVARGSPAESGHRKPDPSSPGSDVGGEHEGDAWSQTAKTPPPPSSRPHGLLRGKGWVAARLGCRPWHPRSRVTRGPVARGSLAPSS